MLSTLSKVGNWFRSNKSEVKPAPARPSSRPSRASSSPRVLSLRSMSYGFRRNVLALLALTTMVQACDTDERTTRPARGKPDAGMVDPGNNGGEVPPAGVADRDRDGVPDSDDEWPYDDNNFDGDLDGVPDGADLCKHKPVAEGQKQHNDADNDGKGDECDNSSKFNPGQEDTDNDGEGDASDNSPLANPGQEDRDGDGDGDVSDCADDDASIHNRRDGEDLIDLDCDGIDKDCDGVGEKFVDSDGRITIIGENQCRCVLGTQVKVGSSVGTCVQDLLECQSDADGGTSFVLKRSGRAPMTDVCGNSLDEDCDGSVDNGIATNGEACACVPGVVTSCGFNNEGICRTGSQTCNGGAWGPCIGAVLPLGQETCNGQDDDCDGDVDEDFNVGDVCTGIGDCGAGSIECAGQFQTRCSVNIGGSRYPAKSEVCDGEDNDCDGDIDEGDFTIQELAGLGHFGEECDLPGVCGSGILVCAADHALHCNADARRNGRNPAELEPGQLCNGADDDCDGTIDDGCGGCINGRTRDCGSDVGECDPGVQVCVNGAFEQRCGGQTLILPKSEVANGKDDDCDGTVDDLIEGILGQACTGMGGCGAGVWEASGVSGHAICSSMPGGSREQSTAEICNGADDDCDGDVDEDFFVVAEPQLVGYSRPIIIGTVIRAHVNDPCTMQGACAGPARLVCDPAGSNQLLCPTATSRGTLRSGLTEKQQTTPEGQLCNGRDDDCDGTVDDGCTTCDNGERRLCGNTTLPCTAGEQICANDAWGECVGGIRPAAEACNGADDDCDGDIDEDFRAQGLGLRCDGRGACGAGFIICGEATSLSTPRCSTDSGAPNSQVANELCNEVDDDCDGTVDDGLGTLGLPGSACEMPGICGSGSVECSGAFSTRCDAASRVRVETCNGADDDCDGDVDEGFNVGQTCTGIGFCSQFTGTLRCNAFGVSECSANDAGRDAVEFVGDGVDSDCDGFENR